MVDRADMNLVRGEDMLEFICPVRLRGFDELIEASSASCGAWKLRRHLEGSMHGQSRIRVFLARAACLILR